MVTMAPRCLFRRDSDIIKQLESCGPRSNEEDIILRRVRPASIRLCTFVPHSLICISHWRPILEMDPSRYYAGFSEHSL